MYYLNPHSLLLYICVARIAHRISLVSSDLNRLIMDYLVIEGYKSAAEEFSQEANLTPPVDFESIESRMDIREALQRGDVEDAITRVNDLNPEVCLYSLRCAGHPDERIKPFHAPLINLLGLVMIFVNQNFSLQYDLCLLLCCSFEKNKIADPLYLVDDRFWIRTLLCTSSSSSRN